MHYMHKSSQQGVNAEIKTDQQSSLAMISVRSSMPVSCKINIQAGCHAWIWHATHHHRPTTVRQAEEASSGR
jgi:hypothetical protein